MLTLVLSAHIGARDLPGGCCSLGYGVRIKLIRYWLAT